MNILMTILKNAPIKVAGGTILGLMLLTIPTTLNGQSWHVNVDWPAQNTDAGGSVDCPADYVSAGVGYAVLAGGRAAVINAALFAAYKGDFNHAFDLVLLTQCHNPDAQQDLLNAGQRAVLSYLVQNWTPVGIDPNDIMRAVGYVLEALEAS